MRASTLKRATVVSWVPVTVLALLATLCSGDGNAQRGEQQDTVQVFLVTPTIDTLSTDSLIAQLLLQRDAVLRAGQAEAAVPISFRELQPAVGKVFVLGLFPDLSYDATAHRVTRTSETDFRWAGRVLGDSRSRVTLVVRNGGLTGTVRTGGRLFQIKPIAGSLHAVVEIDQSALVLEVLPDTGSIHDEEEDAGIRSGGPRFSSEEPIGAPTTEVDDPYDPPAELARGGYNNGGRPSVASRTTASDATPGVWDLMPDASCPDLTVDAWPRISILVAYTPASVDGYGGDIVADIEEAVLQTNEAFIESGIHQRLELVHVTEAEGYDGDECEDSVCPADAKTLRNALRAGTDPILSDIHALREDCHADVVALWIRPNAGGNAFIMEKVSHEMADSAFAVVASDAASAGYVFAHEVGHIMGARHERAFDSKDGQPFNYNHGYVSNVFGEVGIMALGIGTGFDKAGWYSNPDIGNEGEFGIPSTDPGAADNRKTLNNTAATVARFRMTPAWFLSASAESPWLELRVSDYGLSDLAFGDFNGDGETDVFRVEGVDGGSWWVSYSGKGDWEMLNTVDPGAYPLSELAFADFDNDGVTDVFRAEDTGGGTWKVSYAASGTWDVLHTGVGNFTVDELVFGNFVGDAQVDVFRTEGMAGESWQVWPHGATAWDELNSSMGHNGVSDLAFADIDGNGTTDVLARGRGVEFQWLVVSDGGAGQWRRFKHAFPPWLGLFQLERMAFADFDGDGDDDIMTFGSQNEWYVSLSDDLTGSGGFVSLDPTAVNYSCYHMPDLRFGDFNGDGVADAFRVGVRP